MQLIMHEMVMLSNILSNKELLIKASQRDVLLPTIALVISFLPLWDWYIFLQPLYEMLYKYSIKVEEQVKSKTIKTIWNDDIVQADEWIIWIIPHIQFWISKWIACFLTISIPGNYVAPNEKKIYFTLFSISYNHLFFWSTLFFLSSAQNGTSYC